ncbi:MAG: adenylyl-sulfate kinase [Nitrospirota bacterium]
MKPSFCIWFTGLPASGKSRLAGAVADGMRRRGLDPVVLESDALRRLLTPEPDYSEKERGWFYGTIVELARMFVEKGVPVLIDATGNRRAYRARGRQVLHLFAEVFVDTPLDVCMARDPKGIYRKGRAGESRTVPGLGALYEAPEAPEVVCRGDQPAEAGASKVLVFMEERGWIE